MRHLLFAAMMIAASPSLSQAQDAAAGERLFAQCRACHQVGETAKNTIGPTLNGVIGRKAGSLDGYSFSNAMKAADITWDEASFSDYIKDPKAKVPGTKMIYPGLKDEKRVADLFAFLKQFGLDGKKAL